MLLTRAAQAALTTGIDPAIHPVQPPTHPSDPHATAVQSPGSATDDASLYPQIAGYRMLRKLGQGGMATVYLATQESLDRPVSIKVMERDALLDETSKQRFENEARTVAKLSHPSIVSIHEVGRTLDGRLYYSMPFLPNGDLAQRDLDKDEARIVDLLRTLLSALNYAHARDIVHRDVKRENILFDADNRPLLADFGIALSKTDTVRVTTAGLAVGSSGYMAPEQARGDAVDGRADLYSVGVLAYELLTGALPYYSSDAFALALMHAQKSIPQLPPAKRHWQGFIDRAMAKSPEQRFANAGQMLEALDRIGRRSGNHLSGRVLRTFDRTIAGSGWKRPRVWALGAVLLLAAALYTAHQRLSPGSKESLQTHSLAATPASTQSVVAGNAAVANMPTVTPNTARATSLAAVSASAKAAAPESTAAAVALRAAREALDHRNLIAPPGKNAVDMSLAAWELAPNTADTSKLVGDVLKALFEQQRLAISQHNDRRVVDYQQKAELLANATIGQSASVWRTFRSGAWAVFVARAQKESNASDAAALARTTNLAKQLEMPPDMLPIAARSATPANQAIAQANPTVAAAANPFNRPNGIHAAAVPDQQVGFGVVKPAATSDSVTVNPAFVFLHGPIGGYPAAAIQRNAVTRREYGIFVNATHRAAADCSNQKALGLGRAENKNWSNAGFAQNSNDPVVCVSWDDASAYAQWFGQRSGQRYRLSSFGEWRMATAAGMPNALGLTVGNVSEWLQDCAFGCQRHRVTGGSWRDRGTDPAAFGRAADRGFADIGFRIVQVLAQKNAAVDAASAATTEPPLQPQPSVRPRWRRTRR